MTININLLPWREEKVVQRQQQYLYFIAASAGFALFLLLISHFCLSYKIGNQEAINDRLRVEIANLDTKILAIENLQKEKASLLARMNVIQQLQRDRPKIVKLFDNITKTVPEGLYLTSLNRTGSQLLIEGKAESNTRVSKFMRNIEASAWLTHPVLNLIQADDTEKAMHGIGFSLQAVQSLDTK